MGSNLRMQFFFSQMTPTVERAYYSVGKHNSTRVDEGRKCRILLAIKKFKSRTVMGREEQKLLSDP